MFNSTRSLVLAVIGGLTAIVLISSFFGSFYSVDQGELAVVLRNGAITGVSEPGLHYKLPFIDEYVTLSTQERKVELPTMSAYSRDQQPAAMHVSVNYTLTPSEISNIYADYGSEQGLVDRIILPRVNAETKNVFGQFNAVSAIQERERLQIEVLSKLQQAITGVVHINSVQIEEIDFSAAYEQSIEARMLAEVDVQKIKQTLEQEKIQAQIAVTKAQAAADSVRLSAEAEADSMRLKGQASADAIAARGEALRSNPGVAELTAAERWDGQLPTTMVPGSAVPFIGIK